MHYTYIHDILISLFIYIIFIHIHTLYNLNIRLKIRLASRTSCFPLKWESKQVNSLLYVKLILDPVKISTLMVSTATPALISLRFLSPVPACLLSYRPRYAVHSWAPAYSPGPLNQTSQCSTLPLPSHSYVSCLWEQHTEEK